MQQVPILQTSLERYTVKDWINWISENLRHEFALPVVPFCEDPIHDMFLYFNEKSLSSDAYQDALVSLLRSNIYVFREDTAEEPRKVIERLLYALSGSADGITNYEALYEMFLSEEFDNNITEHNVFESKSHLLQILSKCQLKDDECDTVMEYAHKLLKQRTNDYLLYSGILRFCHRRHNGMFFITFLSILKDMSPEKFDNLQITNILVDKIEEVAFHNPPMFEQDFNIFIANLLQTNIPKAFRERIRKAGMRQVYMQ